MVIIALGINHKTATVAVRELVAFSSEVMAEVLSLLNSFSYVHEISILSTCNRTELYAVLTENDDVEQLLQWLASYVNPFMYISMNM
jgi:glutamyl-tRNA reductase